MLAAAAADFLLAFLFVVVVAEGEGGVEGGVEGEEARTEPFGGDRSLTSCLLIR